MNRRMFSVKCGLVLAVLITILTFDNAQGKTRFEAGSSINCDHRYPWTCDVRTWSKAAKRGAPFRAGRDHVRHKSAVVRPQAPQAVSREAFFSARPRAWCGWFMALRKGIHDRRLWVAREWARVGRPASGPAPGVIGVMRHHVYEVIRVIGPGLVLAISGNDGRAVRTRVRSTRGTFAWRSV